MSKFLFSKSLTQSNKVVTVLPDFFLDIIVDPNYSYAEFMDLTQNTYDRGGGNIIGPAIDFLPGGNAGNVVLTTNNLGMKTYFMGETSELGLMLIEFFFKRKGVYPIFTTNGELASSFILEFKENSNKINIMASSSKSIRNFGPDKLTDEQIKAILESNFIAITNFQNSKLLELIDYIFNITRSMQIISIDFSDLTPHVKRVSEIYDLFKKHADREFIVCGNETEISLLGNPLLANEDFNLENTMKILSSTFPNIFFCLHTTSYSQISFSSKIFRKIKTKKLAKLKRITGAGDSWHGGLINGISLANKSSLSLITSDEWYNILLYANFVAGYWVFKGKPGSLQEINGWVEKLLDAN